MLQRFVEHDSRVQANSERPGSWRAAFSPCSCRSAANRTIGTRKTLSTRRVTDPATARSALPQKGPQNNGNHDVLPERWREVVAVHELNASLQISEVGIGLHACSHKEKYAVAACPAASVLSSWQHWQATSSLLRSIWEGNHPKQFVRPTTNARSECEV